MVDIREVRWDKGKSYHRYSYTVKDLARLSGMSEGSVRGWFYRKGLHARYLSSVVRFIEEHRYVYISRMKEK